MPKIKTNNINIFYETYGSGEPLVMIAGFAADHLIWQLLIRDLAKQFQVVVIDNRGVGQTDSPDTEYTLELMADDTVAVMDALNINKATILGHSMGGFIAQELAIKYPTKVKNLILYSTSAKTDNRSSLFLEFNGQLFAKDPEAALRNIMFWLYSADFLSNKLAIESVVTAMKNNPYPQTPIGFIRQLTACKYHDTTSRLNKIQSPTLVIAGEKDVLMPLSQTNELAAGIKNAELAVIPEMGHCLHIERPQFFLQLLNTFLNKNTNDAKLDSSYNRESFNNITTPFHKSI